MPFILFPGLFAGFGLAYGEELPAGVKVGAHFIVRFDGRENLDAGHLIGLVLEEAYLKVGADLGYWPEAAMEAVLYTDREFYDITESPSWAGAIYDGRIKMPVKGVRAKTESLERVLFHEYTHAVVHRLSGGRAPTWLNEGLAQYEEGKRTSPHKGRLREMAGKGDVSLADLEGPFTGLDRKGAERAYLLSLSATEYLVNEFGLSSVKRIFEGLKKGIGLSSAIHSAVFLSYEDLERSWLNSISR